MSKLPALTGSRVVRALERGGFVVIRISGSHHRLAHVDDPARVTTVPVHAGMTLKRGKPPAKTALAEAINAGF